MLKLKRIISVIIILNLFTLINPVPINITKFECHPNRNVCSESFCYLKSIRKRLFLFTSSCYYKTPIKNFSVRLALNQKVGNQFRPVFDFTENGCKVLEKAEQSQIIGRFAAEIRQYGTFPTKCPFDGNVTLLDYPVDLTFFPNFVRKTEYQIIFVLYDIARKKPMTRAMLHMIVNI